MQNEEIDKKVLVQTLEDLKEIVSELNDGSNRKQWQKMAVVVSKCNLHLSIQLEKIAYTEELIDQIIQYELLNNTILLAEKLIAKGIRLIDIPNGREVVSQKTLFELINNLCRSAISSYMIMQIVEQVKNTNDYNDDQKKHVINKHLDDLRRNLYSSNNCREITIESLMAIGFMTSDEQKESHELFNETCKRTVMRLEINRINGEEYNPGKEEMDRLIETCFPNSRLAQEKDLSIKDARATEKSIASAVEVISVEKAKRTSNPVNLMARMPPKINIDKKEMEKIYAEFLIKHEWSEWTTTSLARETGISQPTWYRRIKKDAKFLAKTEEVLEGMIQDANDKLKNIPSIMRYISDLKEELETKKKNNKERSTSGNSILINNLPSDKYSEIDRFANNYDEDIIINLSRGDLIEEISNINDHIKREELESWSLDKLKNYFRVLS